MAGYGPKQASAAEKADKEKQISLENQRRYDTMVRDLKDNKLVPQNASVHIPPRSVDANSFSFDDKHINEERNHNVTKEQDKKVIEGMKNITSEDIKKIADKIEQGLKTTTIVAIGNPKIIENSGIKFDIVK